MIVLLEITHNGARSVVVLVLVLIVALHDVYTWLVVIFIGRRALVIAEVDQVVVTIVTGQVYMFRCVAALFPVRLITFVVRIYIGVLWAVCKSRLAILTYLLTAAAAAAASWVQAVVRLARRMLRSRHLREQLSGD